MIFYNDRVKLKIGTRGSPLALAQSRWVESRLKEISPSLETEIIIIKTSGDLFQNQSPKEAHEASLSPQGTKGLFVKEIEEGLLKGEIDLAVHSAKDMPAQIPNGLHILAYPQRESPQDIFIGRNGISWKEIKPGQTIGTSSLRRQIQLKMVFPEVNVLPLRGNVDTRLKKLEEKSLDGIILAAAGLKRLGREISSAHLIDLDQMVPPPRPRSLGD